MAKQQILFIINPIAGGGKSQDWPTLISENLEPSFYDYEIRYTRSPGDATIWANDAAKSNFSTVCAVGGDGTINEVAQGLIGSETALAIIPRGSGNGLGRHFSIPIDPKSAIRRLNKPTTDTIDVGLFNGKLFLCVAGIGFDAQIAQAFDLFGARGLASYAWLSLKSFLAYRPNRYNIEVNNNHLNVKAFLIAFANASQFGNNAYIAPEAKTNDGLLNLVLIKPFKLWQVPSLILHTFRGTIHHSKLCKTLTFKHLKLSSEDNLAHLDGEPLQTTNTIEVTIQPKSLRIVY